MLRRARLSPRKQVVGFAAIKALEVSEADYRLFTIRLAVRVHAVVKSRPVGRGWRVVDEDEPLIRRTERNEPVAFPLSEATHSYARRRGDSMDVLLLKPVQVVTNDHVFALHGELRISSEFACTISTIDAMGRALPWWRVARTLEDGELFVGSTRTTHNPDSRFFGLIHVSEVIGVYRPLWIHSPVKAPSMSALYRPTHFGKTTPEHPKLIPEHKSKTDETGKEHSECRAR